MRSTLLWKEMKIIIIIIITWRMTEREDMQGSIVRQSTMALMT